MRTALFLIIFFNVTHVVADDRPNIIFLMTRIFRYIAFQVELRLHLFCFK